MVKESHRYPGSSVGNAGTLAREPVDPDTKSKGLNSRRRLNKEDLKKWKAMNRKIMNKQNKAEGVKEQRWKKLEITGGMKK